MSVPEATAKESEYRTEKRKFKSKPDWEDSENNEGLVLNKEFNVWTVKIQCNCIRNIQQIQWSNLESTIISHAYPRTRDNISQIW
jgi:hypothetical protein